MNSGYNVVSFKPKVKVLKLDSIKPLFLQTYMGTCTRRPATLQSTPLSINLPRACLQSLSEHLVWSGCPLHSEIQVPLDPTHVCTGSSMCKPSSSVGGTAKKTWSAGESQCKFAHCYAHSIPWKVQVLFTK